MRFSYPLFPAEFEIPDEWWTESGMDGFRPSGTAYRSAMKACSIQLRQIEPPFRSLQRPLDFHGFDRARLLDVLTGIANRSEIPPVPLRELPRPDQYFRLPYQYQLFDGFLRFYASVAAGFECIPATISQGPHRPFPCAR
jgi:hypothetical protein